MTNNNLKFVIAEGRLNRKYNKPELIKIANNENAKITPNMTKSQIIKSIIKNRFDNQQ